MLMSFRTNGLFSTFSVQAVLRAGRGTNAVC